jgi:hypothetical protein
MCRGLVLSPNPGRSGSTRAKYLTAMAIAHKILVRAFHRLIDSCGQGARAPLGHFGLRRLAPTETRRMTRRILHRARPPPFGSQAALAADAKRAMREILMVTAVDVASGGSWAWRRNRLSSRNGSRTGATFALVIAMRLFCDVVAGGYAAKCLKIWRALQESNL